MVADENFFPKRFLYDFPTHIRHFQRYFQAVNFLNQLGKQERWLDCACGSGYGTNFLADFVDEIIGYDRDSEVIEYAKAHYQKANCHFTHSLDSLQVGAFQTIFSIETIEHMATKEATAFLKSLFNLLTPEGILIISTPIPEHSNPSPKNPFHCYEYDLDEFTALLDNTRFQILDQALTPQCFTDGEIKNQGLFRCQKICS